MNHDPNTPSVSSDVYPHVRVAGPALERGRQYGRQTRDRIHLSIEAYERAFRHYAGWDWARVRRQAAIFEEPIGGLDQKYLDEMRGIADGSGVTFEDVLGLNVRTEIMFSAEARRALGSHNAPRGECTSFCLVPEVSASGRLLIGENWDWLTHCTDTVVVLEVEQDDGPAFVTVVEAGLLAKAGMNSSGIGLVTNALVTEVDRGEPGIPYHVVLRSLLDAETFTDAFVTLQREMRSSAANYLIANDRGVALDLESAPGDFRRLYPIMPEGGVLLHTNHFLTRSPDVADLSLWSMPDSIARLVRARSLLDAMPRPLSREQMAQVLSDHSDYPSALCCHPDEREHPQEQGATILSVMMDLADRRMWLSDGNPCSTPYRVIDYQEFLSRPSVVRAPVA